MIVSAALGRGAARIRNCMVSYFWGKRNNGLKWVMNTLTHKFGYVTHMAVIKD